MEYPALTRALAYCEAHDITLPLDLAVTMFCIGAVKTEAYYDRVLERGVRDLYNGRITADELLDTMIRLLDEQMRRAWNEGMRQNGLDPAQDMTDEWETQLQGIIDGEFSHVEQFITDVETARDTGAPIDPLLSRAQLWAGRYADVVNQSILATAEPKDKYEWIYGDTQHCTTCEALNGLVASAAEWEQSGFRPQSPPNDMLECGGWRCQCRLEPTDRRRSPDVLTRLLDIATGQNVGKSAKGGEGSGNFGHAGRPGEVGGSAPGMSDSISIDADDIEPVNQITDVNKFNTLVTSMQENGWIGPPILAFRDGETLQAVTGSHRIYTAREVGIQVPVNTLDFPGADFEDIEPFLNAQRDEDILDVFDNGNFVERGYITQDQYDIMRLEVEHNG